MPNDNSSSENLLAELLHRVNPVRTPPPPRPPRIDPPGGGGDNGGMDARVAKLEAIAEKTNEQLRAIDKDLAVLRAETKTHIADAKNSIIMWVVSAILLAQLLPAILKKFGL